MLQLQVTENVRHYVFSRILRQLHIASSICTTCPQDMFTLQYGSSSKTSCQSCLPGTYKATSGCELCPAGTRSLQNTSGCQLCPFGQYSPYTLKVQGFVCLSCSPMSYSNSLGSTSCFTCQDGDFSLDGWSSCLSCTGLDCPIGRNSFVCSNHGSCVYGACNCDAGFLGLTCGVVLSSNSRPVCTKNCQGVIYIATSNNTIYFYNSTVSILLKRDGGIVVW